MGRSTDIVAQAIAQRGVGTRDRHGSLLCPNRNKKKKDLQNLQVFERREILFKLLRLYAHALPKSRHLATGISLTSDSPPFPTNAVVLVFVAGVTKYSSGVMFSAPPAGCFPFG